MHVMEIYNSMRLQKSNALVNTNLQISATKSDRSHKLN